MNNGFPEAARPYIDSHIEASHPNAAPPLTKPDKYDIDGKLNGLSLHFSNVSDKMGRKVSGTGKMHVLGADGQGYLQIHCDNITAKGGTHYVFSLPESLYKKIKLKDGSRYVLES